jgi:hypothetical protein
MYDGSPLEISLVRSCAASPASRPLALAAVVVRPLRLLHAINAPNFSVTPFRTAATAATKRGGHALVPCADEYAVAGVCSCAVAADSTRCGPVAGAARCFRGQCISCAASSRADVDASFLQGDPTDGWTPTAWSCVKALPDVLPFAQARAKCQALGADLVSTLTATTLERLRLQAGIAVGYVWTSAYAATDTLPLRWADGGGNITNPPSSTLLGDTSPSAATNAVPSVGRPTCLVVGASSAHRVDCDGFFTVVCARDVLRPTTNRAPMTITTAASGTAAGLYGIVASSADVAGGGVGIRPLNLTGRVGGTLPPLTSDRLQLSLSLPLDSQVMLTPGPGAEAVTFCAAVDERSLCSSGALAPGNVRLHARTVFDPSATKAPDLVIDLSQSTCVTFPLNGAPQMSLQAVRASSNIAACEAVDIIDAASSVPPDAAFGRACPASYQMASRGLWLALAAQNANRALTPPRRCLLMLPASLGFDDGVAQCRARGMTMFIAESPFDIAALFAAATFRTFWAGASGPRVTGQVVQWYQSPRLTETGLLGSAAFAFPSAVDRTSSGLIASIGRCLQVTADTTSGDPTYATAPCISTAVVFCSGSSSQTRSRTASRSVSDYMSFSLTDAGTVSPLVPSLSATVKPTTTASPSISNTGSPSRTLAVSDSLTPSHTATASLRVDPGEVVRVDVRDYSANELWTEEGVTLRLRLEGGQGFSYETQRNFSALRAVHVSSTFWDDTWGIGLARTVDTIPGYQLFDFMRVSVNPFDSREFNITFRNRPQLDIRNTELVYLDFRADAFNSGVRARGLPIVFALRPGTVCGPGCIMRHGIRYAALPFLAANLLVGGDFTYFIDYASTIILLESDCVSEMAPLPFIVHPLQVPIGSDPYRYYFGALVCNVAILAFIMALFEVAIARLREKFNYTRELAEARVHFPGVLFFPYVLLTPGAVTGAVSLLAFGAWWERLLGALGLAFVLGFGSVFVPLLRSNQMLARFVRNPRTDDAYYDYAGDDDEWEKSRREKRERIRLQRFTRAAVDVTANRASVDVLSFEGLYGMLGVWAATDRDMSFVLRFRFLFVDFYGANFKLGLLGVFVLWVKAALLALRPFSFSMCVFEAGSLVALEILVAGSVVFLAPFRRRIHNVLTTVVTLCHVAGLVLFFISLFVVSAVDWTLGCYLLGQLALIAGLAPFIGAKTVADCRKTPLFVPVPVPLEMSEASALAARERLQQFAAAYTRRHMLWKHEQEEERLGRLLNPPDLVGEMLDAVAKGPSDMMKAAAAWREEQARKRRQEEPSLDFGAVSTGSGRRRDGSPRRDPAARRRRHAERHAARLKRRAETNELLAVHSNVDSTDVGDDGGLSNSSFGSERPPVSPSVSPSRAANVSPRSVKIRVNTSSDAKSISSDGSSLGSDDDRGTGTTTLQPRSGGVRNTGRRWR